MPTKYLNGKHLAQQVIAQLKTIVAEDSMTPGMAAILVGDDAASELYVRLKEKSCKTIGTHFEKHTFPKDVEQKTLEKVITQLNTREDIHAILVQLPLPEHLNADAVIACIDPNKDVDGFHPKNIARYLAYEKPFIRPVLIRAILRLIQATEEFLRGKHAVILGNSDVFMRPLGTSLLRRDMQVIWQTLDDEGWEEHVAQADLLITALGKPHIITKKHVKPGVICIDIGITKQEDAVHGDITPDVSAVASWMTPVPGGVGPMTVAMLMQNVVELAQQIYVKEYRGS